MMYKKPTFVIKPFKTISTMQTVITSLSIYNDADRNRELVVLRFTDSAKNEDAKIYAPADSVTLAIESAKVARQFAIDARDAGLAFAARQLKGRTIEYHTDEDEYYHLDSIGAIAASPAEPAEPVPAKPATRSSNRRTSSKPQ